MRHISLCLIVPFVLACGPSGIVGIYNVRPGPALTIRVEGTVTAADDGSPIVGALVKVWDFCFGDDCTPPAQDTTDGSGDYSLSFVSDRCVPENVPVRIPGHIIVTHPDFEFENIGGFSDSHMTCTEELQIIDIQLRRRSTAPHAESGPLGG